MLATRRALAMDWLPLMEATMERLPVVAFTVWENLFQAPGLWKLTMPPEMEAAPNITLVKVPLPRATLHTPDSVQTIQRIYSVFPAEQQNAISVQLANSLQAIVSQKLLPKADGSGRVLACEVCIATPAVRRHICEQEVHHIYNELQTGKKHQMQTMDSALLGLYQQGVISYDVALSNARETEFIKTRTKHT